MKRKIYSIFFMMLLITTFIPIMGTADGIESIMNEDYRENSNINNHNTGITNRDDVLLFEQIVHDPSESWSFANSDDGQGYSVIENFWGLTEDIGKINYTGLTIYHDGTQWVAGTPVNMEFNITFYSDDPTDHVNVPDQVVATFTDITPDTYILTGQQYSGFDAYEFEFTLPSTVSLSDGWVSVQSSGSDSTVYWFLWGSAQTGDVFSFHDGAAPPQTDYDRALRLFSTGPSLEDIMITALNQGWNFVSLPFNQSIDLVNLTVNYSSTDYTWTAATGIPIVDPNVYGWDRNIDMYIPATTMESGYGYWIYAYFDCELWMTNISATPDTYITDLKMGWNAMGVPSDQPADLVNLTVNYSSTDYTWTAATGIPIVDPNVYGWDRNIDMYVPVTTMEPGYAYWIYAYQDCRLSL